MRVVGGGDLTQNIITLPCVTDAHLGAILLALENAGGKNYITNKFAKFSWAADYQIADVDDGDIINGRVIVANKIPGTSLYDTTFEAWCYTDINGTTRSISGVVNMAYTGSMALRKTVVASGAACAAVKDGTSGGNGAVVALDHPSTGYVDVLV